MGGGHRIVRCKRSSGSIKEETFWINRMQKKFGGAKPAADQESAAGFLNPSVY